MQQIFTNLPKRFGNLTLAGALLLAQILGMAVFMPAQASAAESARKSPTTTLNNGWDVNSPSLLQNNDDIFAVYTPGDTSKSQAYGGFNLGVPAGATVDAISLQVIAKTEKPRLNNGVECVLGAQISIDGGATWSASRYMSLTQTKNVPVNNTSTSYFSGNWAASSVSAGNFAVRLTVVDDGVGCDDTGKTYVDSLTAWTDYIPSTTPTTGTLRVVKYNTNTNGGELLAKDFLIHLNDTSLGVPSSTTAQNADGTSSASYNNIYVEAGVPYTVSEPTVPTGYKNNFITCFDTTNGLDNASALAQPFTPSVGQQILCNVDNSDLPQSSSITIIKDSQPNSLQDFSFSAGQTNGAFTLDDDAGVDGADDEFSNSMVFDQLDAGVHTFKEEALDGWDLIAINCTGSNGITTDLEDYTVSIDLKAGENVVCTFVNEEHYDGPTASITVVKDTDNIATENDQFTFQLGTKQYQVTGDGQVVIDNIRPGTYDLTEVATNGWWLDWVHCGEKALSWLYDEQTGDALGVRFTLEGDEQFTCTFYNFPAIGIGGVKFEDANGDGEWNWDNEPALPNWTIQLFSDCQLEVRSVTESECESELIATTTTDSEGYYEFSNVKPYRSYKVCEVQKSGWAQSSPVDYATYAEEPWYAFDGCYHIYAAYFDTYHFDFGNYRLGKVEGVEFYDLNKNGAKEANEQYLADWEISLYKLEEPEEGDFTLFSLGDPTPVLVTTTLTDANGYYSFANLKMGDYQVCQTPQAGWTRTFPVDGNCQDISIAASGQVVTPVDFGNWTPEPQVLGSDTLTNTGASALMGLIAALSIIGVASGAAVTSRQKQN